MKTLMLRRMDQAGFTLLEVIITMAVSSSLLLIAFFGQGAMREQAQFDVAMDSIKNNLNAIRNESISTVNQTTDATGLQAKGSDYSRPPDRIFFAKLARFSTNSATSGSIQFQTLIYDPPSNSLLADGTASTYQIPWGIFYTPNAAPCSQTSVTNQDILFQRDSNSGRLAVYTPPNDFAAELNPTSYTPGVNQGILNLCFSDSSNRVGEIQVNATTGEIVRVK